jgi:hypothetical protein
MQLKDLRIGMKVLENTSGILFLVGEHGHEGYEGTTLVSDKVIRQACLDAVEPGNPSKTISRLGNNYYPHSNLHQWLNTEGRDWFNPMHEFDVPPSRDYIAGRFEPWEMKAYNAYDGEEGFLSCFGDATKDALIESEISCINRKKRAVKTIPAKVFCLSMTEVGINPHGDLAEGSKIRLFNDYRMRFACPTRECVEKGEFKMPICDVEDGYWYWFRTPHASNEGLSCYGHSVNPYCFNASGLGYVGVHPAMNIQSDIAVSKIAGENMYMIG